MASRVGDLVWGIWGHRSHAVLPAERVAGHQIDPGLDPIVGTFDRVGAVALNAVLASDARIGETVAVFGQGVIGLLATQLLVSQGCQVLAIDTMPARLELARSFGATPLSAARRRPRPDACETTPAGRGVDRVIELTGAYPALHQAIRVAGAEGTVIAAGFYQGPATALALGEEFHHNRVNLVCLPDRFAAGGTARTLEPRATARDGDGACVRRAPGSAALDQPRPSRRPTRPRRTG